MKENWRNYNNWWCSCWISSFRVFWTMLVSSLLPVGQWRPEPRRPKFIKVQPKQQRTSSWPSQHLHLEISNPQRTVHIFVTNHKKNFLPSSLLAAKFQWCCWILHVPVSLQKLSIIFEKLEADWHIWCFSGNQAEQGKMKEKENCSVLVSILTNVWTINGLSCNGHWTKVFICFIMQSRVRVLGCALWSGKRAKTRGLEICRGTLHDTKHALSRTPSPCLSRSVCILYNMNEVEGL